jgi:dihydrofolate reductase
MNLEMIAAVDSNLAIGFGNAMPWHLPDDLKYFKRMTLEKTVLMGRKTFLSIGKALPKRRNLVLTRDTNFTADGIEIVHGLDQALALESNLMVIGGGEIYTLALPLASAMHLTFVDTRVENADAFFPKYNPLGWQEVSRIHHDTDEKHAFSFDWVTLTRNQQL